ncbi:small-conductance mechanosensitive channel [Pedobacter sp. AK017]|uniref:mechanosensitive ion channel family protein n=1 Tax=Pedobacter sp. AK017 TaxID=2723073 RepID=UPI00160718DF|nr:mechanosensitive ion channel family protein [Pedobacter sp. AK017]MBB5438647.1 small-conductance mechanosensitive channel [Pedobacter sp. AK017]
MSIRSLFVFIALLSICSLTYARQDTNAFKGYPVIAHADTLFHIKNKLGSLSAQERAERTSAKVEALAEDLLFVADSLVTEDDSTLVSISYKGNVLLSLSKADADSVKMDRQVMVKAYQEIILNNIHKYKKDTDLTELLKRGALGILIISILGICIFFLNKYSNRFNAWLRVKLHQRIAGLKIKNYELISGKDELLLIRKVLNLVKILVIFILVYLTLPIVFRLFPWTKPWSDSLIGFVLNPLKNIFSGIIAFIPDLITIAVIVFVFHYIKKAIKFLANEIEAEKLKINGFYADWAKPTFNIVRLVLNAFMLVVIWPFIPGSDSGIFKGVSVFLGLLISFGSSSAISNGVAGMVITYMRPFKLGDIVKIGDTTGTVLEKSLLVTRILTFKNEVITIPNSAILNGNTVNYSSMASQNELIIHTSVTLGYDLPWAQIHELLIAAALASEGVIKEKAPFVLQTSLEDWYVSYELNVYINNPQKMPRIYSELHKQIHIAFDAAGVEIMSPHYQAIRDGNASTVSPIKVS